VAERVPPAVEPAARALGWSGWLAERRAIFVWWAGARALVLITALVIYAVGRPYGYFPQTVLAKPFGALTVWDGIWYRRIAVHGYLFVPGHQSDTAFFPLYPVLLRAVHATGLPLDAAGLLLSNLFLLVALLAVYELGLALLPAEDARRAAIFVAVFPTSYVFSMIYPESLVLGCMVLALLLAVRGRWLGCGFAAAAAALARPEGAMLVLPLAAIVVDHWRTLAPERRGQALAAVLAAPATLVSFMLYLGWAVHDPFAWNETQQAWGRSFSATGFFLAIRRLVTDLHKNYWGLRDALFCVAFLILLALAARAKIAWPGKRWAWIAFGLAIVLLPLASGSMESDARFGLLALPIYWGLAVVARRPWLERGLLMLSTALLVAATATIPLIFP
jgi:Mannosyltransferase (PIG-V)